MFGLEDRFDELVSMQSQLASLIAEQRAKAEVEAETPELSEEEKQRLAQKKKAKLESALTGRSPIRRQILNRHRRQQGRMPLE